MKIQKRSFVLLEVFIGLTLLTFFSGFLLRIPLETYRKDLEVMESLERDRLFALAFSEINTQCILQKIPWKTQEEPYFLEDDFLRIPEQKPRRISRSFTIKQGKMINTDKSYYQKLAVEIFLGGDSPKKSSLYYILRESPKNPS